MFPDRDTLAPAGRVLGPLLLAASLEPVALAFLLEPGALEPGWYGRAALLRATHAVALGVIALSIVGAGWQLVPVVTARPWRARAAPLVNGGLALGLVAMLFGLQRPGEAVGHAGVGLVCGALMLRSLALIRALAGGEGRLAPRLWLVLAEGFLWIGLSWGVALWLGRAGQPFLGDPLSGIGRHGGFLLGGWVGGWVIGTGSLLLPMFAVGREPPGRWMGVAVACWAAGLVLNLPLLWSAGLLMGLGGLLRVLLQGARRGPALLQAGAGMVGVGTALALLWSGATRPEHALLLGLVLGALPVLRGVAQRILPFLAWTHAYGARMSGAPPVSALTPVGLARAQALSSLLGAALLVGGRMAERADLARAGAALMLLGALLHLFFLGRAALLAALGHLRGQALAGTERP